MSYLCLMYLIWFPLSLVFGLVYNSVHILAYIYAETDEHYCVSISYYISFSNNFLATVGFCILNLPCPFLKNSRCCCCWYIQLSEK